MHTPWAASAARPGDGHDVFVQFRRLLVGTMVEVLREAPVDVDLGGLDVGFEPESGFRFLWVDNWMRFRGFVTVPLRRAPSDSDLAEVKRRVVGIWPEVIGTVGTLPLADHLDITRHDVTVAVVDGRLDIRFDLEAD